MADVPAPKANQNEPDMTGWLFKWTNYLKGYQRRWFVLKNGHLSYYRAEHTGVATLSIRRRRRFHHGNQAEMTHTCRGSISLHGALIHTVDACTFVISNGGTQTFHIRAASEVERQCWVTALELSKAKAIRNMESEEDDDEQDSGSGSPEEWSSVVRDLQNRLEDLQTCADLIAKHGQALQRALGELESNQIDVDGVQTKSKAVGERATLFRIASNAMINACSEYLQIAQLHGHKWTRLLQHEREQRQRLQEMVETLAQQHSKLEQAAAANANRPHGPVTNTTSEEEEDETEFYDAVADGLHAQAVPLNTMGGGGGGMNNLPQQSSFTLNIPTKRRSASNTAAAHNANDDEEHNDDSSSEPDDAHHSGGQSTKQVIVRTNQKSQASIAPVSTRPSAISHAESRISHAESRISRMSTRPSAISQHLPQPDVQPGTSTVLHASHSISHVPQVIPIRAGRVRRQRVPEKPNYPLNLWSIMKNCIGKDLSKIPMPVNFSEPLSMLQRLAEDFEYADLLDVAAKCTDTYEQLAYVAAFTISSYSTTSARTGKPFNPLLGETFECDRTDDHGWRLISEQVSHHPPMVAQHCEGKDWVCWQEFTMTSKFRGKYLQVVPMGMATVQFKNGNRFVWRKVTTTVHNIIVGKLWVDQHGDMEIIGKGAARGVKCHLKFIPYSYFSKDSQRRVKGAVVDPQDNAHWVVNGIWDEQIEISHVIKTSGSESNPVYETAQPIRAWVCTKLPKDSEKYYNFTVLASQLNEPEEGVAPTDSRNRPDQRLMEEREWDLANKEKLRLEEKQRLTRRTRESEAEIAAKDGGQYPPYEPIWFEQVKDEDDAIVHVYKGEYWQAKEKQDWSKCPNIF